MATTTPDVERIPGNVTIGEFDFEKILITRLTGLFKQRNTLKRFNCVDKRYGVYYFFKVGSDNVPYVGLAGIKTDQKQHMKNRLSQYFKFKLDSGNQFGEKWVEENHPTYQDIDQTYREHFKPYIERYQLRTLSIDVSNMSPDRKTKLIKVIKYMEHTLICKFKPPYNDPFYNRLTTDEQNRLASLNLFPRRRIPRKKSPARRVIATAPGTA